MARSGLSTDVIIFIVSYFGTIATFIISDAVTSHSKSHSESHSKSHSIWSSQLWEDPITWHIVPESTSSMKDLVKLGMPLIPFIVLWRYLWKRYVFSVLAKHAAGLQPSDAGTGTDTKSNATREIKKHEKFVEQAWLALHYSTVTALEVWALYDKPWFPRKLSAYLSTEIESSFEERIQDHADPGLRLLYMTQFAFYSVELGTFIMSREARSRKDAFVYLFHHIYSVVLLLVSWSIFQHRIGSLILLLHDSSDILLPIGKCFTYSEAHVRATKSKTVVQVVEGVGISVFIAFAVVFAVNRLLMFGMLVWNHLYTAQWGTCCGFSAHGACIRCPGGTAWDILCSVLLCLLYPFHVYWFTLILKMAVSMCSQNYEDLRSDDEGEGENEPKLKQHAKDE